MAENPSRDGILAKLETLSIEDRSGGGSLEMRDSAPTEQTLSTESMNSSRSNDNIQSLQATRAAARDPKYKHCITVGIDFAMSRSAVSFKRKSFWFPERSINNETQIMTISEWPGKNTLMESSSVPTTIAYSTAMPDQTNFGHQTTEDSTDSLQLSNFKALLHGCEETASIIAHLRQEANKMGKDSSQFIIDYLRILRNHTLNFLNQQFGPDDMAATKVQFVLGVPPCYKTSELFAFRDICVNAGFSEDQLSLGSEIEAVFISLLMANVIPALTILPYIIVDIGALTADATSYVAWRDEKDSELRINELTTSQGIISGAVILEEKFMALVVKKLRSYNMPGQFIEPMCSYIGKDFKENLKLVFDGTQGYTLNSSTMRELEEIGLDFNITSDEMKQFVFNPVLESIKGLIERQLLDITAIHDFEKSEVYMYLCGGLSANPYLSTMLQGEFLSQCHFRILPYEKEELSRGLVFMGTKEVTRRTISRQSIGVRVERSCDKNEKGSAWSFLHNAYVAEYVEWLIAYGQELVASEDDVNNVRVLYAMDVKALTKVAQFHQIIYVSEAFVPEARYTLVEDLPEEVKEINQIWEMAAYDFFTCKFKVFQNGSNGEQFIVDLDLEAAPQVLENGVSPHLQFELKVPGSSFINFKEVTAGGKLSLSLKNSSALRLASTLATRSPDGAMTTLHKPSTGKMVPIHPKDSKLDAIQKMKESVKRANRKHKEQHSLLKSTLAKSTQSAALPPLIGKRGRGGHDSAVATGSGQGRKRLMTGSGSHIDKDEGDVEMSGTKENNIGDDSGDEDVEMND